MTAAPHFPSDTPCEITERVLLHLDEEAVIAMLRIAINFHYPNARAERADPAERAQSLCLLIFDKYENQIGAIGADMNIHAAKNASISQFIDNFKGRRLGTLAFFSKAPLTAEQEQILADAKVQHIGLQKLAVWINKDRHLAAKSLATFFAGDWTVPTCPSCKSKMAFDPGQQSFRCISTASRSYCRNFRVRRPPMAYKGTLGRFLDEANSRKLYASFAAAEGAGSPASHDIPHEIYERHFALYRSKVPSAQSRTPFLLAALACSCAAFFLWGPLGNLHRQPGAGPNASQGQSAEPPQPIKYPAANSKAPADFPFQSKQAQRSDPRPFPSAPPELPAAPITQPERNAAPSAAPAKPVSAFVCQTVENRFYATTGRCGADAKYAYPFTVPPNQDFQTAAQAELNRKVSSYSSQAYAASQNQVMQQQGAFQIDALRPGCQRAYAEYRDLSNRLNRSNMTLADFQYYKAQSASVRKYIDTQCIPNQIFE